MSQTILKLSEKLANLLKNKGLTLAVAESCTGGGFSSSLTDIPGSSQYFLLGVVAYSNQEKEKFLKIPSSVIKKYSAVSEEVSRLMAKNVRKISRSDIGVGITGYAGPKGGTSENPVGTVYISFAFKDKIETRRLFFKGSRLRIKKEIIKEAIRLLLKLLTDLNLKK